MRYLTIILFSLCSIIPGLQATNPDVFEPPDFNITAALLEQGVDISQIPELNTLQQHPTSSCQAACITLTHLYNTTNLLAPNTEPYQNTTASYWSRQQTEPKPTCIFIPNSPKEISILILLARLTNCPFAVTSGGHAAFAGASNIQGGITVLLKNLNDLSLNNDKSIVSVGAGNRWIDVYKFLNPYGLAAVGSRDADIGVGGFITGGGISFYSNLYGLACDNVEVFEVITARGTHIHATKTTHPTLYRSLRGGGNNFGLITRFHIRTIPSPNLLGGTRIYNASHTPTLIQALANVALSATADPHAQQYLSFIVSNGKRLACAELTYTKDSPSTPPIFAEYRAIPALSDSTTSKSMVQYSVDVNGNNPSGLREVYWAVSVILDERFVSWVVGYFYEMFDGGGLGDVRGVNPALVVHPFTGRMLGFMGRDGGNALGLEDGGKGPLLVMQIACWWADGGDDGVVYEWVGGFWERVIAEAKRVGVYHEFVYMNYASQFQDVVGGYGGASRRRLVDVARTYDPTGVFQRLQPGYFKLEGAPVGGGGR
ncbi:FAD binding domain protein [Aspergillus leporis]|uniref:FAD binding domain protein n=1 Tax=Aspergillus leporis TaxID=41062 RepID=A0A5N5WMQ0_9EURO|nr:FAD binding domain protein [Aspergillus leporis]